MHITCCAYYDLAFSTKGAIENTKELLYTVLFISLVMLIVENYVFLKL